MRVLIWLREFWLRVAPGAAAWLPRAGVALLLLAAVFAGGEWLGTRGFVRAEAVVTENVATFADVGQGAKGGVVYSPRVRFRDERGALVQVLEPEFAEDAEFAAGEGVPVLYRASAPGQARIATVWRVYRWGIVLGVLGTALFDLGLVLRVMGRRVQA